MHPATAPEADLPAALTRAPAGGWLLAGHWTAQGLGDLPRRLQAQSCDAGPLVLDGSALKAIDSAGAWVLQHWLGQHGAAATLQKWPPRGHQLMDQLGELGPALLQAPAEAPVPRWLEQLGRSAGAALQQALDLLAFIGEVAVTAAGVLAHPRRLRWRTVLRHIQIGGANALAIVGLMSFLLGIVVAYQVAGPLRNYGANVLVVDLVGLAMLREFAPLMSAIIIAGRSGSAYAAQIGTMVVTDEVDAMRTLGINPLELLVLPKLLALVVAMPLLTVFADITGVFGGMVMAQAKLGIGMAEFTERFGRQLQGAALLLGVGKSLVFAVIIVLVGCFQGFRTRGSADSVGRQTTLSVVQAIFLVIVADAAFSVLFNMLDL